jgi:hypothetical protein
MAHSEALAMAASAAGFTATSYGLTEKELQTLRTMPFGEVATVVISSHSDSADTSVCAICFSDYEAGEDLRELHCQHLFHKACGE